MAETKKSKTKRIPKTLTDLAAENGMAAKYDEFGNVIYWFVDQPNNVHVAANAADAESMIPFVAQHYRPSRGINPVPATKTMQLRKAAALYENFTGHAGDEIGRITKPEIPDTLAVIGEIDGILYSTVREGVLEKYIHEFAKKSRPLFAVSPDGRSIHLIGGSYDFTERGIIDRAPSRR